MDSRTGDLYPTKQDALEAGVPEDAVVEIKGHKKAVGRIRMACRETAARRKKRWKVQKASRKRNR